jgi:hypothetical protein|tara:strand:- start:162 stop:377 length:216 start_codon:yes stop_codon:yes gene_type:complete
MDKETVTLPKPPEGYQYKLVPIITVRKPRVANKNPSELTSRQIATLKYRENNRERLNEEAKQRYYDKVKRG